MHERRSPSADDAAAASRGASRRRRSWLARLSAAGLLAALLAALAPLVLDELAGASRLRALRSVDALTSEARGLLELVYADLPAGELFDHHVHLAGIGAGSDCWVNPRMRSPLHLREWARFLAYLSAAGVEDLERADERYVDRLQALVDATPRPARHLLLAFDHHYDEDGTRDLEASHFHVPNEWVIEVAGRRPDRFEAAVSVHPYRQDALHVLRGYAGQGVRFVKWLPNAMGIDPASPRCDAYYATLAELGLALLTHTGFEEAVELDQDQELGNPLRLRRALGAGVRVLAAHCASSGENQDLDHPGQRRSSFELFLRLMAEERWEGLLFGELSTITQYNRYAVALDELLRRTDLHPRLVNGSDWPLPAINVLYRLEVLQQAGFLAASEVPLLRELYDYNPFVFDLALKRRVRSPSDGTRFPASVFLSLDTIFGENGD